MASISELEQRIAKLEALVARLSSGQEQKFNRLAVGGGGSDGGLPPGGRRFDVLMILDDAGTRGWSRPRLTDTP